LGVFTILITGFLWRIENKKDCNERDVIWLRNEATIVKKRCKEWRARGFLVGGSGRERKCCFYSGRRPVID